MFLHDQGRGWGKVMRGVGLVDIVRLETCGLMRICEHLSQYTQLKSAYFDIRLNNKNKYMQITCKKIARCG